MVIILPETRLEKAYQVFAKRVKNAMGEALRSLPSDRSAIGVTVGIASYPQDGTASHDLVLAADKALLEAKKHKDIRMIGCSRPLAARV
jgi:diguanylate cyclase (GGDEF)-like protein